MMEKSKILSGKYQIISEIKKGGFGIVYYGFDKNLGKAIAIKEIVPELLEEAKYIDMFQAEARNAAKLNHHNIVHIFDLLKTPDGRFYIIMEYIDGVDLSKIIKKSLRMKEELSVNLATYIIGEVCKALEYAHNRKDALSGEPLNLIHQDISPSNVMVSMKGDVKLIDFGIARIRHEKKSESKKTQITGKVPYMSPEQLNGEYFIDGRSDIFSLGIVFYELLAKKRLFSSSSDEEIISTIRSGKYNLDLLKEKNIPEALQHIISRALQHDVSQRYQSANQMYLDLAQYLMVASKTIELSEELGGFVKALFQSQAPGVSEDSGSAEDTDAIGSFDINDSTSSSGEDTDIFDLNLTTELDLVQKELNETLADDEEFIPQRAPRSQPALPSNELEFDVRDDNVEIPLDLDFGKHADLLKKKKPESKPGGNATSKAKPPTISASMAKKETSEVAYPKKSEIEFSPTIVPTMNEPEDEEGDDDVKTVIDVVRLASRTYKRQIIAGVSSFGLIILLFFIMDTFMQWSSMGKGIYNFLFPPAIKIVSYPSGAQVYLNDEVLEGRTPLSIQNIAPGVYKLKLVHPDFAPILRSINVPQKGEIKIEKARKNKSSDAFVFRFLTTIEILSNPANANVFINDTKLNRVTPCEIKWEVGEPLTIEMEKPGFQRLSGFTFNIIDTGEPTTDRRFWKITKIPNDEQTTEQRYIVEGFFRKLVQVQSNPGGASIYVDNSPKPIGITGSNSIVYLTFGMHEIVVKKEGFIPQKIDVEIDENSAAKYYLNLRRLVRFRSKDINRPDIEDIGAKLVTLINKGNKYRQNKTTPFELQLDAIQYEARFQKKGYADKLIPISPEQRVVVVQMEPDKVTIEILVTDAISGKPLKDVQIFYRKLNETDSKEELLDVTNEKGMYQNDISHGQYLFKVVKNGYYQRRSNYTTVSQGKNKIRFNLVAQ